MRAGPRPVVVVGDVGLDVLTRPRMPVVPGGEATADVSVVPGGAGGNTSSWLALHGIDVSLIARVGHDQAALAARAALESAGVRCVFAVDEELPTCVVVVIVDEAGERTMLSDRGANAAFRTEDVALDVAAAAAAAAGASGTPHLHVSGYVLLAETSRKAGLAAIDGARRRGWSTSVDPQSAALIAQVGAATFLDWVAGVDLVLPNESEAAALGGPAAVLGSVANVVVTYGAGGARWFAAEGEVEAAAPAMECIDSTGAGDAFNAGLLAGWLEGADRETALAAAVSAGSRAAAGLGARPGG